MPVLIEARLRNEAGEITCVNALARVAHLVSSGPSSPAGCIELALEELGCNMSLNCVWIDLHICWVLDRLAPHKLPRAHVNLLFYQQPSSTLEYCSLPTGKLSGGGGFITGNRRLINVLQVINRQWYIMSARSEVDVMNLSAPPYKVLDNP